MPILDDTEIRALHKAALSASLADSRDALMVGIDDSFVRGLRIVTNPRDQILVDLDALNKAGALSNGKVPLRIWLANAGHLAGERVEAAIFVKALARLPPAGAAPNPR